jgi:hypothetical protein
MRSTATILVGLVLVAHSGVVHPKTKRPRVYIPAAASDLIVKTTAWSAARDFAAIRQVMTDNFVWSFGGDEGPDHAIAEWQRERRYLRALTRVLKLPCRPAEYDGMAAVECPGRGGLSFRAWFVEAQEGWKFTAFVEGD